MRKLLLLCLSAALFVSACKKDRGPGQLDGKWVMVQYYDRSTNSMNSKPANSPDVFLEIEGRSFKAYSNYNQSCNGTFSLDGDKILFNAINNNFDLTHDPWADMFLWAIQACGLQSIFPCKPSTLEWQSSTQFRINTPLRMDIILKKIQ